MNKERAIAQLRRYAEPLQARGATSLYLFGSVANNQATADSDIDLFIDYDENKKFSLVDLVDIKLFLEDELGIVIDMTTRDSLHPKLRDAIEKTAIRVF